MKKDVRSLRGPFVVGVINVTPDSFFAGSRAQGESEIIATAKRFFEEGADILEIGGESTGPASKDIAEEEELQRVIPGVKAVRREFPDTWIAVDTYKSEVAKQAVEAGADIINDVSAGRADPLMFATIAALGCPVVLMYAKDPSPRTTASEKNYDDVVTFIHAFLQSRIDAAVEQGISRANIIVDPGLGHFVSSDPKYSFEILERLREFCDLGPVLVSPSRKSFLAGPEKLPAKDRLPATLDASVLAVKNGTTFIRTHDVKETRQVLDS